jgi:hypothetical protein
MTYQTNLTLCHVIFKMEFNHIPWYQVVTLLQTMLAKHLGIKFIIGFLNKTTWQALYNDNLYLPLKMKIVYLTSILKAIWKDKDMPSNWPTPIVENLTHTW